jgi:hypothetical protein
VLVSRQLMEPDPSSPLPSLALVLWLAVLVLGVVVTIARFAH